MNHFIFLFSTFVTLILYIVFVQSIIYDVCNQRLPADSLNIQQNIFKHINQLDKHLHN